MGRLRITLVLFFALILAATAGYSLTKNLDELVAEKHIIMPDLAKRYPDAEAVIILNEKEIEQSRIINPVYVTVHVAVKILKESAVNKFKQVKIPIFEEGKFVEFQARTINDGQIATVNDFPNRPVDLKAADKDFIFPLEQGNNVYAIRGEEITDDPSSGDRLQITDNAILHKKKEKAWSIREINFPDLRVGSVIEYYYKIEQKRVVLYDHFFFQKEYPVLKASYVLRNARMMRFGYLPNNFTTKPSTIFEPRFTNLENQYNTRTRTALRTADVTENPDTWQFFGHDYFEVSTDTIEAYPKDLPFVPAYADLSPRVDFLLKELIQLWKRSDIDYRVRHTGFSPNLNSMLDRMAKNYQINDRQSRKAKTEIAKAILNATTPEEKVMAAISWVRKNVKDDGELKRWNSYFWGSNPLDPDVLIQNGAGNSDDINYFLYNALQLNGLTVYPAYAKLRDHGKYIPQLFSEAQFDISLLGLEVGIRKYKIFQPSSDIPVPPGYIDYELEGVTTVVNQSDLNNVAFLNTDIPITKAEENKFELKGALNLNENGSASGKLEEQLTGHFSVRMRRKLLGVPQEERSTAWIGMLNGIFKEVQVAGSPQMKDPSEPALDFSSSGEVTLNNVGSKSDKGLVISSSIIGDPYSSNLSGTKHSYDLVFPHTADFITNLEIKIPAGYTLPDSLPAPVELKTRGLYYNRVLAKPDNKTLLIKRAFTLDNLGFTADAYNRRYASVFEQIKQADTWEILLKK